MTIDTVIPWLANALVYETFSLCKEMLEKEGFGLCNVCNLKHPPGCIKYVNQGTTVLSSSCINMVIEELLLSMNSPNST